MQWSTSTHTPHLRGELVELRGAGNREGDTAFLCGSFLCEFAKI
jgi:hypothetical protein